jgi:hypothetical protein
MKTKFTRILLLIVIALVATGCVPSGPELSSEMVASMNAYADQADSQYPGEIQAGIARLCAEEPTALYWNEDARIYAVTCVLPTSFEIGVNIYGVVLLDGMIYTVIHVEHINAASQSALEQIIASSGWVRK